MINMILYEYYLNKIHIFSALICVYSKPILDADFL